MAFRSFATASGQPVPGSWRDEPNGAKSAINSATGQRDWIVQDPGTGPEIYEESYRPGGQGWGADNPGVASSFGQYQEKGSLFGDFSAEALQIASVAALSIGVASFVPAAAAAPVAATVASAEVIASPYVVGDIWPIEVVGPQFAAPALPYVVGDIWPIEVVGPQFAAPPIVPVEPGALAPLLTAFSAALAPLGRALLNAVGARPAGAVPAQAALRSPESAQARTLTGYLMLAGLALAGIAIVKK